MMLQQPRPMGFFARYRKWLLVGAGIGTGAAALLVAVLVILAGGGARAAGLSLSGQAVYGQDAKMEVLVENRGALSAKYRAVLTVDGKAQVTEVATLKPGEKKMLTIGVGGMTPGAHTIGLEGYRADIKVLMPARFTVTGVKVQPEEPLPGTDVTVTATVRNSGEVQGGYGASFLLDGKQAVMKIASVGPGSESTVTATLAEVSRGAHTVSLGGVEKKFSALAPANIEVTGLELSSDYAAPGATVAARIQVKNSGDRGGSYNLQLSVGGAPEAAKDIYVGPGEDTTYYCDFTVPKEGVYDVRAGQYTQKLQIVTLSRPKTGTLLVKKANGGVCTLTISNMYSDRDVIVTLASSSNPKAAVLTVYVRAGEKTKKIKVKNGTYVIFFSEGNDYAAGLKVFMKDAAYGQFDDPMTCKTYKTYSAYYVYTHYTDFELDFNVSGGNARSHDIGESEFPK